MGPSRANLAARLIILFAALLAALPAQAGLREAMKAVRADEWATARSEARNDGEIALAIVEWRRLRAGEGEFEDYLEFLSLYPHWPGMPFLRRKGEAIIPAAAASRDVVAFFDGHEPQTGAGAMRLAAALGALGRQEEANALIVKAWREMRLDPEAESVLTAQYGRLLAEHHFDRLDLLLWNGRFTEAERMRYRVPEGYRALMDARMALRQDLPGVDVLIGRVPDDLAKHPGLAYERSEWRSRKGRREAVAELIIEQSMSAESLGLPEKWAPRRRILARQLMRAGKTREAYLVAAEHHLSEGSDFADLEWLAGFLALRKLDNAAAATAHFRRFRSAVKSPISLGRAGYWEGRAHEALGEMEAALTAYEFGAEFQTSFYGQLAAEKAGIPMDPRLTGTEEFPDPESAALTKSSVFRAGKALHGAGELVLAARFFSHLAESLSRTEIGTLTRATETLDAPYIQLQIAKRAASMGMMLHRAYFPVMPISVDDRPDVEPELALSIARRESEFNPTVISPAGARGLMQVMPATASSTAAEIGLNYTLARLTSDPGYNARIGTAYLQTLREQFGDSTVFVAAAYNAGPSRPRRWAKDYGDPRGGGVDAIDWIEHIPFRETRNYVMRVTESLAPYRARLTGETSGLTLSEELTAR